MPKNSYDTTTLVISQEDIILGNINAIKSAAFLHQGLPDGTWTLGYAFEVGKNKYVFSTHKYDGYYDGEAEMHNTIPQSTELLMEQILSTFKFTK